MDESGYDQAVNLHYEALYRFAFSLVGNSNDASELTQEAYCRLLSKGQQLRDPSKVKSWLFTTLYRVFLSWKRRELRHPQVDVYSAEHELPPVSPNMVEKADCETVMECTIEIDELYRAPLILFYLKGLAYREIAQILDVPIGTVMSRLSRGKQMLRNRLAARQRSNASSAKTSIHPKIIPST